MAIQHKTGLDPMLQPDLGSSKDQGETVRAVQRRRHLRVRISPDWLTVTKVSSGPRGSNIHST
jgi:hypothetical protein